MPPPQPFLASRIGGFVCKSCLSKLRNPRPQRGAWLSRSLASDQRPPSRPNRSKKSLASSSPQPEPDVTVRFFEQTKDGERKEILDKDEESFYETLGGPEFKAYEAEMLKNYDPESDELDFEDEVYNALSGGDTEAAAEQMDIAAIKDSLANDESTNAITFANDRLEALLKEVKSLSDQEHISEEDRTKIRELLFNFKSKKDDTGYSKSVTIPGPTIPYPLPPALADRQSTLQAKFPQKGSEGGSLNITLNVKDFPEPYRVRIRSLQRHLLEASGTIDPRKPKVRSTIWNAYLLCRSALLATPDRVPPGIWSGLWIVLSRLDTSPYVDRMAQIKYLVDDFRKIGVVTTIDQNLLYVEALLVQGETDTAVKEWHAASMETASSDEFRRHYELGVKISCQQGDLDQALRTAESVFSNATDPTFFRILLPIIQTCLHSRRLDAVQLAWALYIRLQVHMGPHMEMSDYDTVILSFLEVNQPDFALGVFKDMMLSPDGPQVSDSVAIYKTASHPENLGTFAVGKKELDFRDSIALTKLPSKFNNKFFFGKWMKKLIGEGELDAAKKVLDVMNERGIRPDARYVNGLIGAWFRQGTTKYNRMGEDMAWRMINSRLQFVADRETHLDLQHPLRPQETFDKKDTKRVLFVPNATIETFCILLQNYRRRQKTNELSDLFATLRKAKIQPNTSYMNEVLSMDSKNHQANWTWSTYESMTGTGIQPDYATFTILWYQLSQLLDRVVRHNKEKIESFPPPRLLFAEMIKQRKFLTKEGPIPQDLYNSIILTFSRAEDQAGTAIAMRALQENFGTYPNEETARTIILQLARLGITNTAGYKSRRLNVRTKHTKDRLTQVSTLFQQFKDDRDKWLLQQGINFSELSEQEKLAEAELVLSGLLRYAFQTRADSEERKIYDAKRASMRAAEQMGIPGCAVWAGDGGSHEV
ncbi:hypothetical protein B0J14DRAFT_196294 [Halenospora varia]|nr:hypothetical protein B0J14DRAFT_196294 [Halenospora varia]